MSGEVCPKCGVAVVPGYVKCPKCHFPLPPPRRGRNSIAPSGTAIESSRSPVGAIILVVALIGGSVAAYFAVRSHHDPTAAPDQPPQPPSLMSEPSSGAAPSPALAPAAQPSAAAPDTPSGPSAATIATELQHALDRQRLWATVQVIGAAVEIRSSSCNDAAMKPAIAAAAPQFKAAGVRRLRCVEESGTVVFSRDL